MVISFDGCVFQLGNSGKYFLFYKLQRVLNVFFAFCTWLFYFSFLLQHLVNYLDPFLHSKICTDHYQEILVFDVPFIYKESCYGK